MPSRNRSRDRRFLVEGSIYHFLSNPKTQFYSVMDGAIENCTDYTGNRQGANGFELRRWTSEYPLMNGQWELSPGVIGGAFNNCPPYSMNPAAPDPLTYYGSVGQSELANAYWETLAHTNPNVPDVSVPQVLGELKDLPGLVRQSGRDLLDKVASGYLSWRWALKPMWRDLESLNNFMFLCNQRFLWLKKLRDGTGLRRRYSLGRQNGETAWTGSELIHTNGATVRARSRVLHFKKVWASVEYKVSPGTTLPKTDPELYNLAKRLSYGITSYELLASAWELFPWSWMIDWFVGVGDLIAANNNTVPLTIGRTCMMRTLSAERVFEITQHNAWLTISGLPRGEYVRKERYVMAPVLPVSLSFPLIDGGKWPILAALATPRLRLSRGHLMRG